MADDIGYATLPIIPSLRGARSSIERELNGLGGSAGSREGDSFAQSFSSKAKAGIGGLVKSVGIVTAGALAAGGALTAMGVKGAASMETTTTSFTALLGSSKLATDQIAMLQKYAAATPFSQQDVLGYAQQYYALAGSVGLSKTNVTQFLDAVGNLGAVTGASTENIHNAVMAIGQMGSSGKITLDNLNQVSEAFPGFNGAAAIANATGQTTAQVMDEISKGTLNAKTGVVALLQGMQNFTGAAGAMQNQSRTLAGLWSTFTDTIQIKLTQAFQPLVPVVKQTLGQMTGVIGSTLQTVAPVIQQFATSIAPALAPLVQGVGTALASVFKALGPALQAILPAIAPIGTAFAALATAVTPVLTLLGQLIGQVGPPLLALFVQVAQALTPVVQAFASALLPVLPVIAQALQTLGAALMPVVQALAGAFASTIAALAPTLPSLAQAFASIGLAVAGLAQALAPLVGPLLTTLASALAPVLATMAGALAQVVGAMRPFIAALGGALLQIIQAVAPMLPQIANAFAGLAVAFGQIFVALTPLIPPLARLVSTILTDVAIRVILQMANAFTTIARAVVPLVPVLVQLINIAITPLTKAFQLTGTVISATYTHVIAPTLRTLLNAFLTVVGGIVKGAASMFGWVPGVGGKLKNAADAIDSFRNHANEAFASIASPVIRPEVDISDAVVQTSQLADLLGQLQRGSISQAQYDAAAASARAAYTPPSVSYAPPPTPAMPSWTPPSGGSYDVPSGGTGGGGGGGSTEGRYKFGGQRYKTYSQWQRAIAADVRKSVGNIDVNINRDGIVKIEKEIRAATKRLNQDVAAGLNSKVAGQMRKQIRDAAAGARREFKNLKFHITGVDVAHLAASASKSVQDLRTAYAALVADMKHAGASKGTLAYVAKREGHSSDPFHDAKTAAGLASRNSLMGLAAQRQRVVAKLDAANKALADVQAKWSNEQSTVSKAFSGAFNVATAGKGFDGNQAVTAGSILAQLKQTVTKSKTFFDLLKSLKSKGMPDALLDQLAQAGPDALPQAQALMNSTPSELAGIKSEYKSLTSTASSIGTFMADDLFKAGVDSAKGLVAGLQSQKSLLDAAIAKIGQSIVDTLRKKLKIHSPSRVMRQLGRYTTQGHALGMLDEIGSVEGAAKSIANSSAPKLGPRGGPVNSTPSGAADPAVVGAVVSAVMAQLPGRFAFDFDGREVARMNEKSARSTARGR